MTKYGQIFSFGSISPVSCIRWQLLSLENTYWGSVQHFWKFEGPRSWDDQICEKMQFWSHMHTTKNEGGFWRPVWPRHIEWTCRWRHHINASASKFYLVNNESQIFDKLEAKAVHVCPCSLMLQADMLCGYPAPFASGLAALSWGSLPCLGALCPVLGLSALSWGSPPCLGLAALSQGSPPCLEAPLPVF